MELYADFADDEQHAKYEQEIAELRTHLDNAHGELKLLKKNKKQNPAALASPGQTWDEAAKAFDAVEETLEQARPQL